ncbi:MAG TPA: DNA-binding response regulator [Lentisphaeria bacterium]|jgi:two-component system phosphate regulon response regulator PhoB|nr:DNA-binding response regulator [Lentisphaeria bacterium]
MPSLPTILIVDDEPDIREMLRHVLECEGFKVQEAANGEAALALVEAACPALVLLDLMMPVLDGHQTCYRLKANPKSKHIPVIMLTAKSDETDEVIGLAMGADDYIAKPFSPRVVTARIKAMLRREQSAPAAAEEEIVCGDIRIRPERHEVEAAGQLVPLTPLEFRLLLALARRPGRVSSRRQIMDAGQGAGVVVTERTVDVHIVSLRKKLGSCAAAVETVRGVGYRLRESCK